MKVRKSKRALCPSSKTITTSILLSFLSLSGSLAATSQPASQPIPQLANIHNLPPIGPDFPLQPVSSHHDFTLRHVFHHGTYLYPELHRRMDFRPQDRSPGTDPHEQISRKDHYVAKSRPLEIQRLADRSPAAIDSHLRTARLTGEPAVLDTSAWTLDELPGPNVTDRDTVITLARMAANAYVEIPHKGEWEEVGDFNRSAGFGWEEDGLRGYVFADETNSTVVMGLKGTSPAVFDGSETTTNDKLNDNLFFSCCCGQGGQRLWRQVCDCQSSAYTCNQTCLIQELRQENRYYRASIELYTNVTKLYPDSTIWLTGHSLGGAVSALLGHTFGLPVVAFEAPGDDLPAKRLGLPAPPDSDPQRPRARSKTGVYHFGHTADPVFMGSCNGAAATCTFGGYAMESQCHTGHVCLYDTVSDLGWRVGIGNHKIHVVIDSVLRAYDTLPSCEVDDECVDCFNWKYFESNGTESTTSSSSSTTIQTRTSTCETPGWWGCLDKTTTTDVTSTSTSTTTTSTSTCKTPGWFGCKDPTTTTSLTQSATPAPAPTVTTTPTASPSSVSSSTTCQKAGWFGGCNDPTSSLTASTTKSKQHCETPGMFWGCRGEKSNTVVPHQITSAPVTSSTWKEDM